MTILYATSNEAELFILAVLFIATAWLVIDIAIDVLREPLRKYISRRKASMRGDSHSSQSSINNRQSL